MDFFMSEQFLERNLTYGMSPTYYPPLFDTTGTTLIRPNGKPIGRRFMV